MKSILIQFGVRNFNPVLRKAREKLDAVRTPEGIPLRRGAGRKSAQSINSTSPIPSA
jgi:hypothetical protein